MSTLAAFQDAFAMALHDEASTFAPASHPAFAIYRNTVMRGCLDALEANFPAVVCLVGRDWFRAAAAVHVVESPPDDVRLGTYGAAFADFLGRFEPASELPYLADVARLDRLWTESHDAADAPALAVATLAAHSPATLATTRLYIHPATRWLASPLPAYSIWHASRLGNPVGEELVWRPEAALVVRIGHEVRVHALDPAAVHVLGAIDGGAALGDAVADAASAFPGAPIDLVLSGLTRSGAFTLS